MKEWSLEVLLGNLHSEIQEKLRIARESLAHPLSKGDASESIWIKMLKGYLPQRYQAEKAFVVDSKGNFSEQIDVVIFDRQYTPFIFTFEGQLIVPAEGVYAVFEAKQTATLELVKYAQKKTSSVRGLYRTSIPIPHAGGTYPPKPLPYILGGLLTFESDWKPPLGPSFANALLESDEHGKLNLGCVASHGIFHDDDQKRGYEFKPSSKAATALLFELIAMLQTVGTVPMIDVRAYADWLLEPDDRRGSGAGSTLI